MDFTNGMMEVRGYACVILWWFTISRYPNHALPQELQGADSWNLPDSQPHLWYYTCSISEYSFPEYNCNHGKSMSGFV
jgi:hypothetical protein